MFKFIFLCGVLSFNSSAIFKKLCWPIKIVKLSNDKKIKFENNQKNLNCKLYLKNYLYLQSKKTKKNILLLLETLQ